MFHPHAPEMDKVSWPRVCACFIPVFQVPWATDKWSGEIDQQLVDKTNRLLLLSNKQQRSDAAMTNFNVFQCTASELDVCFARMILDQR